MMSHAFLLARAVRCDRFIAIALFLFAATGLAPALAQADKEGQWSPAFDTQNVMIHATLLPSGKVLFWGRREAGEKLHPHNCTPRIWDPASGAIVKVPQPGYNMFCSGHTLLADGRVFVAGGHFADGQGVPNASIYDPGLNAWQHQPPMAGGRWYPTVITLSDGSVLVAFGSNETGAPNDKQQVWKDGSWLQPTGYGQFTFVIPPYFPRYHVVGPDKIFMSGPLALTQFFDAKLGVWSFLRPDPDIHVAIDLSSRPDKFLQEYAPSVLFDEGKILFVGGGLPPKNFADVLDLTKPNPTWARTQPMIFPRRQHNATLLPDGTVLVMGGTQGAGAKYLHEQKGFNDLTIGAPIHSAELWNPKTNAWTKLAKAAVDRCYHSTAILLPDATVLSAGGGEYDPSLTPGDENLPEDSHKNGQIFSPPYLFRGPRPTITDAPTAAAYGVDFEVETPDAHDVDAVNWVRLSSVTHSNNMNQRINFLKFRVAGAKLVVTPPAKADLCPPGHYMLFVLNKKQVPSVARIVRIQ
jgi:hypothetical protein